MSIFDIFRQAPQTPNIAPAPQAQGGVQPGNPTQVAQPGQPIPGTQASSGTDNNGVVPTQAPAVDPNTPKSPMADFATLWNTDPNAKTTEGPIFQGIDPTKVREAARSQDFTKTITPEQLAAIAKGGEDAVKAFSAAINNVGQNVFAESALATTRIVEGALAQAQQRYDKRIPSMVRNLSVNDGLRTKNPMLSDPAVAPMIAMISAQLQDKNPNATANEIQEQALQYVSAFGEVFGKKPDQTPEQKNAAKETDWSSYLTE